MILCAHATHELAVMLPQVVCDNVVFPENVDVTLDDIGGLEAIEDLLVSCCACIEHDFV